MIVVWAHIISRTPLMGLSW